MKGSDKEIIHQGYGAGGRVFTLCTHTVYSSGTVLVHYTAYNPAC